MNTQNVILDKTNPVYNTAKLTLSMLSLAGVPEAQMFSEKLGLEDNRKDFEFDDVKNKELPLALMQEARYEFINQAIYDSSCKNIVDIACGFSPRGYVFAKKGYNYIGIDLEASINALNELRKQFDNETFSGTYKYVECDVTDARAFNDALKDIKGEITFVCEGLFMYFTDFELKLFCKALKYALQDHKGRFISSDLDFSDIFVDVYKIMLGDGAWTHIKQACESVMKGSDTDNKKTVTSLNGGPLIQEIFKKYDFTVEKIPYFTEAQDLKIFKKLEPDVAQKVKDCLYEQVGRKISLKQANVILNNEKLNDDFKIDYLFNDGSLQFTVIGHIDSVSSTKFIETYNFVKDNQDFSEIIIDMENLDYITSAGLRVLLMMKKDIGNNPLKLIEPNNDIIKILELSGFNNILEISN